MILLMKIYLFAFFDLTILLQNETEKQPKRQLWISMYISTTQQKDIWMQNSLTNSSDMRQSLKSLHFYAPAILVTLILFDEIDSIFSVSLNTEYSKYAQYLDYTPIEINEYNIDKFRSQSRAEKLYNLESNINDVNVGGFNGNNFGMEKVVSDCVSVYWFR